MLKVKFSRLKKPIGLIPTKRKGLIKIERKYFRLLMRRTYR